MKRAFGSSGVQVPVIGQGSWQMGVHPADEAAALLRGFELGLTHIDTAELYGKAEEVVGKVVKQLRRDELFLVSKVMPQNADLKGTLAACDKSLKKLGTDHLDCYLLHWQGSIPLEESMRALEACVKQGKTRFVGVSNIDLPDLETCVQALGATKLVCNQVYYDLEHRGIERKLLPWCRERGIALVAYSPFGSTPNRIPGPKTIRGKVLHDIAAARGASAAQVVLAFLTRLEGTFAIPKASKVEHAEDNAKALKLRLTDEEVARIDAVIPAPNRDVPLATL